MATMIKTRAKELQRLPSVFFQTFPLNLCAELEALVARQIPIDEVRIRTGKCASVTSGRQNILLESVLGRAEVDVIFDRICDNSLYAHADTISRGYVTLDGGIRVGIVGRASVSDGSVIGVYEISGLCFRLPRHIPRVGAPVCELLRKFGGGAGVLVYSPPAEGKTTLIRAVATQMSSGEDAWRVSVIDSRGELGFALEGEGLCVDVLTGYPRALGIEIASRCMNAQLIVCDEIGGVDEAQAILAAQNCGVPLLATAHAGSMEGLMRRTGIRLLCESGVFGAYVGIRRRTDKSDYLYTVTEVKDDFQTPWSGDTVI